MASTLYHNPRCSKSREALALLQENNVDFEVVDYLTNHLSKSALKKLIAQLQDPVIDLIRCNEKEFKALGLSKDALTASTCIEILSENPKLMQRPIFVYDQRAVIGRPPERVLSLL